MKKNFELVIVLLIGVVLMSGCTSDKEYEQPSKVTQSTQTTTAELSVVEIYCDVGGCDMLNRCTECYEEGNMIYGGIEKEGISYCNRFSDYRDSVCFYLVAMSQEDVSLCDKISILSKKNFCIAMVAIVKKDESLCEKIKPVGHSGKWSKPTDDKNGCLAWVAEAKKDSSLCEGITDPLFKDICIEGVAEAKKQDDSR